MEKFNWQEFFENLKDMEGNKIEIPLNGSMGLLALGDLGVTAWKQRRQAFKNAKAQQVIKKKEEKKKNEEK